MSKRSSKLIEMTKMFEKINIKFESLDNRGINDMISIIKKQNDSRYQPNVRHKMEDIILITLFAVLAKCDEWKEIETFAKKKEKWFRNFLELPNGIPSHDTIQRVISLLDPQQLYSDTINYLISKIDKISTVNEKDILSMDGKVIIGSSRSKETGNNYSPVNTMSIYYNNYGISLIQDYIGEKTNEIPMGPKLLEKLDIKGCVITADALNTQMETINAICKGKADYVMPIKQNQGTTFEEINEYFSDNKILKEISKDNYIKVIEKEHNSIVTREYYIDNRIDWMSTKKKWKNIKSIGLAKKTIEKEGKITIENRYYIVSFENDVKLFSKSVRSEWGVENNLHAPLDITFKEDKNKTLEKNGARNIGIIRRIALALLKFVQTYYKISLNLIRTSIAFDFENEIDNIFKLLDVEKILELSKVNT